MALTTVLILLCVVLLAAPISADSADDAANQQSLQCHNYYRSRHRNTNSLVTHSSLIQAAKNCAVYYANNNRFDHSCPYKQYDGGAFGENLSMGYGSGYNSFQDAAISGCNSWYGENQNYNYNTGPVNNFQDVGHFTQMVWDNTAYVGTAAAKRGDGQTVVVSLYYPPGNMGNFNQYPNHVFPPQ